MSKDLKPESLSKELIKLWNGYQSSGTPYGNTFEGFIEWLKDKYIKESIG